MWHKNSNKSSSFFFNWHKSTLWNKRTSRIPSRRAYFRQVLVWSIFNGTKVDVRPKSIGTPGRGARTERMRVALDDAPVERCIIRYHPIYPATSRAIVYIDHQSRTSYIYGCPLLLHYLRNMLQMTSGDLATHASDMLPQLDLPFAANNAVLTNALYHAKTITANKDFPSGLFCTAKRERG